MNKPDSETASDTDRDTERAIARVDEGLVVVEGEEFTEKEIERSALDNYGRKDRSYIELKHRFTSEEQYELFCMLPGGNAVKHAIVNLPEFQCAALPSLK